MIYLARGNLFDGEVERCISHFIISWVCPKCIPPEFVQNVSRQYNGLGCKSYMNLLHNECSLLSLVAAGNVSPALHIDANFSTQTITIQYRIQYCVTSRSTNRINPQLKCFSLVVAYHTYYFNISLGWLSPHSTHFDYRLIFYCRYEL